MTSTANGYVSVRIPSQLLNRTGQRKVIPVSAETVRDVIEALEREYPGLRFNICNETGELRSFVNIFVGTEDVRYLQGLATTVGPDDKVTLLPAMAGGSQE